MATFNEIQTPDQHETDWDGQGLAPGARAALQLFAGLAVAIAIPYAVIAATGEPEEAEGFVAEVAQLRAWVPGDDPPFSSHFGMGSADEASAEVGNALAVAGTVIGEDDLDLGGPAFTMTAEATPVEDPHPGEGPGAPIADGKVPDVGAATQPAVAKEPLAPADPLARLGIPASAYEGVTAEIEDPHGAMKPFYEALARTALREPGAVTRISQWGDSAIAADGMTGAARQLFQTQFGDAGHGFSLVVQPTPWYLRKHIAFESTGWRAQEFIRKQADDGRYGYGGVAGTGYLGARATWKTVDDGPVGKAASRFEVHYVRDKRHGNLSIKVDGEEKAVLETASDEGPVDAFHVVEVPDGPHTFEIRNVGGGSTRVYGAVIERDGPGVVYDGIGVVGARAARQLNIDDAHWARVLQQRDPDLYILMYGGNAIPDKTPKDRYRESFARVVDRYRAALPDAACLVMSPLDHGERYRGRVRTVLKQHEIMEAQRAVALEKGCAWYSIYDAMGGEGAMGVWYDKGLAASDLAHPTARGSLVLGKLFFLSTMKGLHDFLDARRAAPPEAP